MLIAADNELLVRTSAGTPMGEYFRRLMLKQAKNLRDGKELPAAQHPGSCRLRSGGAVLSSELSFEEVMTTRFGSATGKAS